MGLTPGSRLGPYEIVSTAGAGGMGEVYKARDSRLGRTVALKVLPAELAGNARLRLRFEREAKAISSLNHPHICTLHDLGSERGIDYLVMEYCEGVTLAERIAEGPIPTPQVLQHGIEIASAIARAHRQGFAHRDLKPSNVMLTKSGAKVLDFGLAARLEQGETGAETTVEQKLTREGTVPGTTAYLAPELLHGAPADARSDLFAFGLILYEMTTGARAFTGSTSAAVIAAILEREPPSVREQNRDVPPELEALIRACLVKDPEQRMQSAHDVEIQLRWIAGREHALPQPGPRLRARSLIAIAALLAALAVVTAVLVVRRSATRNQPPNVRRLTLMIPVSAPIVTDVSPEPTFAAAPDGTRIAYVAFDTERSRRRVFVRELGDETVRSLDGTDDAIGVYFSPDSDWIAFSTGAPRPRLHKISLRGGPPTVVAETGLVRGLAWLDDATIVFGARADGPVKPGLFRVVAGKPAERLTSPDSDVRWPAPVRGATGYVLCTIERDDQPFVAVFDLRTRTAHTITPGWYPRHDGRHSLLFARGATVHRMAFDPATGQVSGNPEPLQNDVLTHQPSLSAKYDAGGGMLFYLPASEFDTLSQLAWLDRTGRVTPVPDSRRRFDFSVRLSPDGTQILSAIWKDVGSDQREIWAFDVFRQTWERITEGNDAGSPLWSPDGRLIAYSVAVNGIYHVFIGPRDRSETPRQVTRYADWTWAQSWSRDRQWIAASVSGVGNAMDILLFPADGRGQPAPFATTAASETFASFSPDGRWIVYRELSTGTGGLLVRAANGKGPRWTIAADGTACRWRSDGREIVYMTRGRLMSLDVTQTPPFVTGKPRVLFEARFDDELRSFDLADDGKRILLLLADRPRSRTQIRTVEGLLPQ